MPLRSAATTARCQGAHPQAELGQVDIVRLCNCGRESGSAALARFLLESSDSSNISLSIYSFLSLTLYPRTSGRWVAWRRSARGAGMAGVLGTCTPRLNQIKTVLNYKVFIYLSILRPDDRRASSSDLYFAFHAHGTRAQSSAASLHPAKKHGRSMLHLRVAAFSCRSRQAQRNCSAHATSVSPVT